MTRQTKYIFRDARIAKNLTITELSAETKIPPSTIKAWEAVGSKITIKNLKKISKSLEISPNELIFGESDERILNVSKLTPLQIQLVLNLYLSLRMDED